MKLLFLIFCLMMTTVAYADDNDTVIERFDRQMQAEDQAANIDYIRRQNNDIMESQQRLQEQLNNQANTYLYSPPYPPK